MAITKAAKKAIRKSEKRRKENIVKKRKLKNLLKKAEQLLSGKKTEEIKKLLPQAYKFLDKAVKTGLIKKNTANRKKSALAKSVK